MAILLMIIGGYSISGYLWLFYLMIIGRYSINGYLWLSIIDYWWLFY
jgi:hypothetical protein